MAGRAGDVLDRLQLLASAPKHERNGLAQGLEVEVSALEAQELAELLALCEHALPPSAGARQAVKQLLKACRGRRDLRLEALLEAGVPLPSLAQVARQNELGDLPPSQELADRLLAWLLSWEPSQEGAGPPLLTLLQAIAGLGLAGRLRAAAPDLLRHGLDLELRAAGGSKVAARALAEVASALPEWRCEAFQVVLASEAAESVSPSELVRLAQDWGLHEDPEVFDRLRDLVEGREAGRPAKPAAAAEDTSSSPAQPLLPVLTLSDEEVVLVDNPEAEASFAAAVAAALARAAEGAELLVGLDAEWHDPRPLSLLQLAVSVAGGSATVFLVDMVARPSQATLECCRQLLRPQGPSHTVLAFGPKEDQRRLGVAGLLPECCPGRPAAEEQPGAVPAGGAPQGWLDLQQPAWGLGPQPSLKAVVEKALGSYLDKRLQRSAWDDRPLCQEQVRYAALDASVLLRLLPSWRALPAPGSAEPEAAVAAPPGSLTPAEERERWARWRSDAAARGGSAPAEEGGDERKNINGDLRFAVVSALAKLARKMRGLGLDTLIVAEDGNTKVTRQLTKAAVEEGRIILSRSRKMNLAPAAFENLYIMRNEGTQEQLKEVIETFGVEVHADCLCGRCVVCNTWDWRFATPEDLQDNPQVNEKTLACYEEFWLCGGCGKVFWEGSMFEKAVGHFRTFMPENEAATASAEPAEAAPSEAEAAPAAAADLSKYDSMEEEGCSAQRIRAQMVRDGVLPPAALPPEGAAPPARDGPLAQNLLERVQGLGAAEELPA